MIALVILPLAAGSTGLAPSPVVGFVLQVATVFGAVGGLVALRAHARSADVDTWRIVQAWGALGLVCGVLVVVARTAGVG